MNLTKMLGELFIQIKGWIEPALDELREKTVEIDKKHEKRVDDLAKKIVVIDSDGLKREILDKSIQLTAEKIEETKKIWEEKCSDYVTGNKAIEIVNERQNTLKETIFKAFEAIPIPKTDGFVTFEQVKDYFSEEIQKIDVEEKEFDLTPVFDEIHKSVTEAVANLPKPVDGKDGSEIDILPSIDTSKSYARGTVASHNGGLWRAHTKTDGMRGWDLIIPGIPKWEFQQVDERNVKFVVTDTLGNKTEQPIAIPSPIYRHIWKEGNYQRGDMVTWGGSLWHCNKDTTDKPGTSEDWTLCAKRGRDGKNYKDND